MQALVDAQFVVENRDTYMLQYILRRQNMLSTTEYKVLQGQDNKGLLPCYRVVYNGYDKLDYDIEKYNDLYSALPGLAPDAFLQCVCSVAGVMANIKDIGFLHMHNLETSLDKVFVDPGDNTVHMVYLPISGEYLGYMNQGHEQNLKSALLKAIQSHPHLFSPPVYQLCDLLADTAVTMEQIKFFLAGFEPRDKTFVEPANPTGTMAFVQTGEMTQSRILSDNLAQPPPAEQAPVQPPPVIPVENQPRQAKWPLFGGKRAEAAPLPAQSIGTEVLDALFVPGIVLVAAQGKLEILVDKQEFFLGKQADKVNGVIDEAAVSRVHCKIMHSDGRDFIIDLGSSNGTYVNGAKVEQDKPLLINEGDRVRLGNVNFTVRGI